ncbi:MULTISPECIES: hypothetical protein [Streptomyces]|uniref:Uncharacterized protein n=1 Tax=Streptomyces fimbriatus TaxID=68197 RepID=A0ABW0DGB0_STRFI
MRGPLITQDLRELGAPPPGRTAIVHTLPDGTLTLLDPGRPYGTRRPHPATYYLVDLTAQQVRRTGPLPAARGGSFIAAVELSWHVADPVAFVRAEVTGVADRLLTHLLDAAARITRRHPVRRAGAAQREVAAGLDAWPVPGVVGSCSVRLAREGAPPPGPQRRPEPPALRPADLLAGADTVLIGFDGPLVRLFSSRTAREAALELLAVVAARRPPGDALEGRPPAPVDLPRDALVHPLEVLRAFAHDRLGPLLRERLDAIELRAAPDAPMTHRSAALVRALHASGRRVVVVSDVGERTVRRCLRPHRLPLAGVHGRGTRPRPAHAPPRLPGAGPERVRLVPFVRCPGRRADRLVGRRVHRRPAGRSPLRRLRLHLRPPPRPARGGLRARRRLADPPAHGRPLTAPPGRLLTSTPFSGPPPGPPGKAPAPLLPQDA